MTVIGLSDLSECNLVMGCAKKIFNGEQGGREFDKRRMAYMRLTPLFKCGTSGLNGGHLTTHMWRLRTAPKWDVTGFICFPDYR